MTAETSPTDGTGSGARLDWRLMLPVFLIVAVHGAGMAAVLPVLPFFIREMGATPLVLGVVIASEAFSQFVAAPFIGQLSDRFGRKRVLLVSQAVAAFSLLALASAEVVFLVLLARTLFGLTAGIFSAAVAYMADHSPPEVRRQAIGVLTAAGGLGGIVGAGLSGVLSGISLIAPMHAAFALTCLSMGVAALGLKEGQPAPRAPDAAERESVSFRAIAGSPLIRVLIVVMMCHFFAYGMYSSQLPVFLGDNFTWNGHAFGPREFSYLVAADGVINILVQLFLLGWLGRRFGERGLIVLISVIFGTGVLLAGLADAIPLLALAVLCVSAGDALAKPAYLAALSVHVPQERQGIVMGTAQSLVAATDVVSPVLGGFILGQALYGVWIGAVIAIAVLGATIARARLPGRDPETRRVAIARG